MLSVKDDKRVSKRRSDVRQSQERESSSNIIIQTQELENKKPYIR